MKNITTILDTFYKPGKALVIFTAKSEDCKPYVESFDFDEWGHPINTHPLTVKEAVTLGKILRSNEDSDTGYLQSEGILPKNILKIHQYAFGGFALWTSPAQQRPLYFSENVGLNDGPAYVPPMLWKATADRLQVWALPSGKRPQSKTRLYYAPFFNISSSSVCMGTVAVNAGNQPSLQEFTKSWEDAFWNTAFSHLNMTFSPTKSPIVQLWKGLIGTDKPFPMEELKRNGKTINDIIS